MPLPSRNHQPRHAQRAAMPVPPTGAAPQQQRMPSQGQRPQQMASAPQQAPRPMQQRSVAPAQRPVTPPQPIAEEEMETDIGFDFNEDDGFTLAEETTQVPDTPVSDEYRRRRREELGENDEPNPLVEQQVPARDQWSHQQEQREHPVPQVSHDKKDGRTGSPVPSQNTVTKESQGFGAASIGFGVAMFSIAVFLIGLATSILSGNYGLFSIVFMGTGIILPLAGLIMGIIALLREKSRVAAIVGIILSVATLFGFGYFTMNAKAIQTKATQDIAAQVEKQMSGAFGGMEQNSDADALDDGSLGDDTGNGVYL